MVVNDVGLYLVAGRQAGLSGQTLRQYGWHLKRMAGWLEGEGVCVSEAVDRTLLRRWGAGLRDSWSPATVRQAVCAARSFFAWLLEEELIERDPGRGLKLPRVPVRVQRTLSAREVRKMLWVCDLDTVKGLRDAALVSLLIDTGLRAGETCGIQVTNLDLEGCRLFVTGKGGDEEVVYYGETTSGRLRSWVEIREGLVQDGASTVFVSVGGNTPGRSLTTRGLRSILRRVGGNAGVTAVSPHAFRRGFACIAIGAGAPTRQVQMAGRWKDIKMVERYTLALRQGRMHDRWSPADYVENSEGP